MIIRKGIKSGQMETLADKRQVKVICSTSEVDRSGEVVVQEGIDCTAFKSSPTVLWGHDNNTPVARCLDIGIVDGKTVATVQFPPEGTSAKSDEVYGLIKEGVINSASIGFSPVQAEPMDPSQPKGPKKYLKTELCEFSFVSVPAVRSANIIGRAHKDGPKLVIKGLYDVGRLAELMASLGWVVDNAAWEAAMEEDGSQVPAMLGDALTQLGAALIAMTAEEVAELLADKMPKLDALDAAEVAATPDALGSYVMSGKTPEVQKFRAGIVDVVKAGRVLSTANHGKITQAHSLIGDVLAAADAETEKAAVAQRAKARRLRELDLVERGIA